MNAEARTPIVIDSFRVVRDRCAQMRVQTLILDASGEVIDGACEREPVQRWLASPFIRDTLRSAATRWGAELNTEPREIIPGAWIVGIPVSHRRRRAGYLAGVLLSPAALDTNEFIDACRAAGLDPAATRAAMRPVAIHAKACLGHIQSVIKWFCDDQAVISDHNDAVSGFSKQLTESYEEVSLLYKLGRSMNELVQPENFVRLLCDELHATLSFRIVCAAFVDNAGDIGSMAGRFVHVGAEPHELAWLERSARDVLGSVRHDRPDILELPLNGEPVRRSVVANALAQPVSRDGRIMGVILVGDKRGEDPDVSSVDIKLVSAAASYLSILLDNSSLYEDQQAMFIGTVKALTASIDAKDRYTRGHSERVAMLTRQLAERAGMSPEELERVHIAGLVHDVGKIGVPESVLRKPGKLTEEEFEWIKRHPDIGHRILRDIPQLADVLPGVLHHHERWDGAGYPHGLRENEIPFIARLIAVADSFDAMSSTRTYRPAMPRDRVLNEILRCAGSQFDPDLAPLFVDLDFGVYDRMVRKHKSLDTADAALREPGEGAAA